MPIRKDYLLILEAKRQEQLDRDLPSTKRMPRLWDNWKENKTFPLENMPWEHEVE